MNRVHHWKVMENQTNNPTRYPSATTIRLWSLDLWIRKAKSNHWAHQHCKGGTTHYAMTTTPYDKTAAYNTVQERWIWHFKTFLGGSEAGLLLRLVDSSPSSSSHEVNQKHITVSDLPITSAVVEAKCIFVSEKNNMRKDTFIYISAWSTTTSDQHTLKSVEVMQHHGNNAHLKSISCGGHTHSKVQWICLDKTLGMTEVGVNGCTLQTEYKHGTFTQETGVCLPLPNWLVCSIQLCVI